MKRHPNRRDLVEKEMRERADGCILIRSRTSPLSIVCRDYSAKRDLFV